MAEIINQLDAGFVMAVILFLFFFFAALFAGISDLIIRKFEERKVKRYYAQFHEPIGRVTDYRVISNGYQPRRGVTGPLNPPSGGSCVQSTKLVAKRLTPNGGTKAKGKR